MARPHIRRRTAPLGIALAMSTALAGCLELAPYQDPQFAFQPGFDGRDGAAPVLLSNAAWWESLEDQALNRLIVLALRDNPGLAAARARVEAARSTAAALPGMGTVTSSAGLTVQGTEDTDPSLRTTGDLGLSWMLDPYGRRDAQLRGAEAGIAIAEAEEDAARLLLIYNIANAYAYLRYEQRILALSRAELTSRSDTLSLTRTLMDAEAATRLEIARSEARVAELRAELPGLEADVSARLTEIAVLTGTQPGQLPPDLAGLLAHGSEQPHPHMAADVGIPADLLRNRPDIQIAERSYYAAIARVDIAQTDLYPRLSLSGGISLNALSGGTNATEYFFGPFVEFPTLPLAAGRASVEARHAEARVAHAEWQSTVLGAIGEVETALVQYAAASEALTSAARASQLYGEALSLTRAVFEREEATLNDLIVAQTDLSQANRRLAQIRLQHALGFIDLNVRLGAGHAGPPTGLAAN